MVGYMYMDKIVNDQYRFNEKQVKEVRATNPKAVPNASGFGAKTKKADLQILPLEAPEVVALIGVFVTVFAVVAAL